MTGYILSCVTIFFLYLVSVMPAEASREVSGKRECSTCHIMWLKDFNRKDVKTLIPYEPKPVVKTGKQDVSSTSNMCFSCHDGFVLESREVWKSGKHTHPVGQKPSKHITIPTSKGKTIFPLNDDGRVYCGTCHTAHGVSWNQSESPVFLRIKNVESSMCMACHLEKSTGPKEGNHPVLHKPPTKPHQLIKAGAMFAKDGGVICQSCHTPHAAATDKILRVENKNSSLCLNCHADKKSIINTKHNLTKSAPDALNAWGKTASESGICESCHKPHGAKGAALWARFSAKTKDKSAARCMSCHKDEGIAKDKTTGIHSHPTMASIKSLGITIKNGQWQSKSSTPHTAVPLYDNSGHKSAKGSNVSCGSCHDPHKWSTTDRPSVTKDGEFIEGDMQSSFLRLHQDGNSSLCLNCHIQKKSVLASKHNMFNHRKINKKDLLKGGVCGQCHQPHNAKGSFIRSRHKDSKNSSFSGLCQSCHSDNGLAAKKQVGQFSHPVGIDTSKLKTKVTKLPLYDSDGNRTEEDGLVDCVSCHNAHQWAPRSSKQADMMKEGDTTNSFLRITASHKSSLCITCHKDKKTVLGTDHDMKVTAKTSVNAQGQDVKHSGVCGQCHVPHNAKMDINLWAREPAKVVSAVEKMCLSCHATGKAGSEKIPVKLSHPAQVKMWSNAVREKRLTNNLLPDIPVFNKKGKAAHVGVISCLSCHNPHQWQAGKHKSGDGKNHEGDAMSSFLRNNNSELILCADCHGKDAIFRYKYFHGVTSRKKHPLYQ